ncbi:diguanylate cyclase [Luteimonas sp. SJ-92]|uniref:diguanylate cyclase n=1 Tax=Luteimonas salinisoli TaxID=2752307 RepID=A0A853JCV4_9GAMM|nr:ligand-binding sensor domain-containing diguanylate cyclase [Luteimonas salinisoli]NZA27116.1 diguanylate cyclase [Luteimonas salinisoli]
MARSSCSSRAWRVAALLALPLWLWLPLHASALEGAADQAGRLSLEAYGPDQGLSQSTVNAMQGDDQGFLWVATQEGLNRFDGHRFEVYRRGPVREGGLLSSSIDALAFEHGQQRLWLGTNDSGLEVVHLPSWERTRLGTADGISHSRVSQILPDPAGGAWVGTGAGVDHVDATLDRVVRLGAGGDVVQLVAGPREGTALALDRDCRLWRATRDALELLVTAPGGAASCVGLQHGPEGAWLATARRGLYLVDADDGAVLRHYPMDALQGTPGSIGALLRLADGRVLVGLGTGAIVQLGPGTAPTRPLPLDGAPDSGVVSLHEDDSGTLWIGTYTSGLYQVRPLSAAIRHDLADADAIAAWPSSSLRAIWRDGTHRLLGSDAGLMQRHGAAPWQPVKAFAGHTVRAIARAAEGGWWIGTHGGLWHWNGADLAERVPALPDPRIEALLVEGDIVWVATRGGLARLESGRAVDDPKLVPLRGRLLTSLLRDRRGTLWVGSNADGLWRLDDAGMPRRFRPSAGELHESLWSLHEGDDALWVGSFSGGLFRVEPGTGRVRAYTDGDGLFNNVVYRILEDAGGRLWLSTNNGLSVLDPPTGIVQNLRPRDGLRNREFNSGAALRDAEGLLYFGGTRGLDVIDPRGLPARSPAAHPVLTALRVVPRENGGDELRRQSDIVYAERIALDHGERVFSIEMTAIDFTAPDAARLRYRMLGLHREWVQPQSAHAQFSVSHLPPGRYTLEVQAAGRDGLFGPPRTLEIDMAPPWWRHGLAYAGYALLGLLLLAWLGSRIGATVRRERRQIELLNRTVAERTAQLQDANQRLRRTNEQLDVATRRDPLTRISNRRDLQAWLGRETSALRVQLEQAMDGHERLAFFMIDIDDFKQVNDVYGHQAGDEVLVHFADRLRLLCREQDLLVRWGGEEFLLISRFTRIEDAMRLAERIRDAIARQPIRARPGVLLELTCSIGFAPWPFSLEWPALGEWEDSVAMADRCLYAAKRGGKNAWVGLAPGPAPDEAGVLALLAGTAPDLPGPDCVQVLHSGDAAPRFDR